MLLTFRLCGGRAQNRNNGLCHHDCLGESCHGNFHPGGRQFSYLLYIPWCLSSYCLHDGAQRNEIWISLCVSPLRGTAWDSKAFHFTQPQFLLFLSARSYGGFSSKHWNPRVEGLVGDLGLLFLRRTSVAEISLLIFNAPVCVWDQPIPYLCPTYLS